MRDDGTMRAWVDDPMEDAPMLWTASLLLLRHLEASRDPGWWRGRRILELGSGAGHLAVGMARLGAHVVATESGECGTFGPMQDSTKRLLAERAGGGAESSADVRMNETPALTAGVSSSGTVAFRKLHWGLDDMPPADWSGFDDLIMAELTYDPDLHEALLGVVLNVLAPGMTAYSVFVDRPFSLNFMVLLHDAGQFDVEELHLDSLCGLEDDLVLYAHRITRRA